MKLLRVVRQVPAPLVALVYLALWVMAEAGRQPTPFVMFGLMALAMALARVSWIAALVVLALSLVATSLGLVEPFRSTTWPAYLGIAFTIGLIWWGNRLLRPRVVSVVTGVALTSWAAGLMVVGGRWGNWETWTGSSQASGVDWSQLAVGGTIAIAIAIALGELAGWGERRAWRETAELVDKVEAQQAELGLAGERERIAQEMHDVVAHSLAVIVAQADGARFLEKTRPAAMAGALEAIAASARTALVDVRGMIDGIVDGVEPPQPTLAELDALLDGMRDAGLELNAVIAGEPQQLGPAQQAAVYRIVQEGLTNALRHRGRRSSVHLVLDWRGPGLSIQLVSSGTGERSTEESGGSGRGIPGMIERARLAGGWLAAGVDDGGDHRVTGFVPFRTAEVAAPTAPLPHARGVAA
ncbi:sensor histidine kinase [Schumannella sp. 10F1B-5-1]|uniref:sensor histidine kinase n=1 Tax=Schumannella sp. 10F1B-5-1 TaxID=2590780 RepID=UPI001131CC3F|nr:histidine kinase [Schumannella sp. 10F1B-5-1]